jgi:hypothetical protein
VGAPGEYKTFFLQNRDKKKKHTINKTKSWFFEKISKIDKPLANMTKIRERIQINKIRNEKEAITMNTKKIQGIIRDYFENLYSNKLEHLEEMDKFLGT